MNAIPPSILFLFLLTACASPAPTPDALMRLPPDQVFEVRDTAPVPTAVAYANILERARRCWQRADRVIDADSYSSQIGVARLSVKSFSPTTVLVVVEVSRETGKHAEATRIVGRSLVRSLERMQDLRNLRLWAEGKKPPCAGLA